jgi:EAL domain-containing protein (putative c-di-GMP-specific phosphodiesterase class I)
LSTPRLLVIDDDEQFARFVAHVARGAGWEVRIAAAASEIWLAGAAEPDVVFLDLNLPDSDGLALLREFAARGARASIHVFSGADPRILRAATQLARDLALRVGEPLGKPIGVADLRRVLAAARADQPEPAAPAASAAPTPTAEELRAGMGRGELFAVFQPILDLATLEPHGAEALLRWRHPRSGLVSPGLFVPLAEENGLAGELTDVVVDHALRFAQRRRIGECERPLSVSVNLAPMVLSDRNLPERFGGQLGASGVAPQRIVVEVTESAATADRVNVLEVLGRLSLRGVELSIDDFGTGSSSFERLDRLPCAELKIERAFVSQIFDRPEAAAIVRSTIDLAHRLGLRTVAEGIEDERALGWLRAAGCDLGQGFLFSRGLEPEEFERWLDGWPARRAGFAAATT